MDALWQRIYVWTAAASQQRQATLRYSPILFSVTCTVLSCTAPTCTLPSSDASTATRPPPPHLCSSSPLSRSHNCLLALFWRRSRGWRALPGTFKLRAAMADAHSSCTATHSFHFFTGGGQEAGRAAKHRAKRCSLAGEQQTTIPQRAETPKYLRALLAAQLPAIRARHRNLFAMRCGMRATRAAYFSAAHFLTYAWYASATCASRSRSAPGSITQRLHFLRSL